MSVVLETTVGDITVDLFTRERPRTCLNFLKLCKTKYYNFCLFHKVQRNFMAQTGDPTNTGRGGESVFARLYGEQAKYFEAETKPRLKHVNVGTISMVNNGSDLNGSQFFLTLGENLDYIDEVHSVFGEVAEGLDVLIKINDAICDESHKPYQDIRITHTVILEDPYDDPSGLVIPDRSPELTAEQMNSGRIAADEEIDDTKGKTLDEIEEEIQDKEAKARATILEMVGDIPDVDVKPPENVLFVCKLNPVTTAEDLEVIFSRFGKIVSCEVIKDKQSNESLQYAFIEFENEPDCENAYFKMDNVLIDDRRIHVDFSQSVAKFKWQEDLQQRLKEKRGNRLVLKEKVGQRQDKQYDMVFDDGQAAPSVRSDGKRSKHSKKDESLHRDKYGRSVKRKESPQPGHRQRSRSRSRSPNRKMHQSRFESHSPGRNARQSGSHNHNRTLRMSRSSSGSPRRKPRTTGSRNHNPTLRRSRSSSGSLRRNPRQSGSHNRTLQRSRSNSRSPRRNPRQPVSHNHNRTLRMSRSHSHSPIIKLSQSGSRNRSAIVKPRRPRSKSNSPKRKVHRSRSSSSTGSSSSSSGGKRKLTLSKNHHGSRDERKDKRNRQSLSSLDREMPVKSRHDKHRTRDAKTKHKRSRSSS